MKRKALVVGATGLVGKRVVNQILQNDNYEKVTILVRNSSGITHDKLEEVVINFQNIEEYEQYFYVNDVFSCLGTTIKTAKTKEKFKEVDYDYTINTANIAKKTNVQNFLVISSLGANSRSRVFYNKVKGEVERDLVNLSMNTLFIFRPSLLLGDRKEFRIGEKVAEKIAEIFSFVFTGKLQKYKPIHAEKVAKAMIISALKNETGNRIIESNDIDEISKKYKASF